MFTGIITDMGTILSCDASGGDVVIRVGTSYDTASIKLGESIACNGCCLTVIDKTADAFDVQLSTETLRCTAGDWAVGDVLNLECALKLGDDLSGHFVTGHVDGVAVVSAIAPSGDSHVVTFTCPPELTKFIAPKGSITLSGVSLTVNQAQGNEFTVNLIPHSWAHTNFSGLQAGSEVNLEVDVLARYVVNAMDQRVAT